MKYLARPSDEFREDFNETKNEGFVKNNVLFIKILFIDKILIL